MAGRAGDDEDMPLLPITSPETLAACQALAARDGDVFIASYPKSGTTWVQHCVTTLLAASAGVAPPNHVGDAAPFLEIDPHWEHGAGPSRFAAGAAQHAALGRRVFNTHLRWAQLPGTSDTGSPARYVYLVRDGRDACTSFYHHLANQRGAAGTFEDSPEAFVDKWLAGSLPYGRWADHVRAFALGPARRDPRVLFLRYEDLLSDLEGSVLRLAEHVGGVLERLGEPKVRALAAGFTFDAMRADLRRFQPVSVEWAPGFSFLRKGVTGDHASVFSEAQLAAYDSQLEAALGPGGLEAALAPRP